MPQTHYDGDDLRLVSDVHPYPMAQRPTQADTEYVSAANEISAVVKASAGILKGISGVSTENAFLHFFDATSLPSNGAVPKLRQAISANVNVPTDFVPAGGVHFDTGIVFAVSSTNDTLTVSLTNTVVLTVFFE